MTIDATGHVTVPLTAADSALAIDPVTGASPASEIHRTILRAVWPGGEFANQYDREVTDVTMVP